MKVEVTEGWMQDLCNSNGCLGMGLQNFTYLWLIFVSSAYGSLHLYCPVFERQWEWTGIQQGINSEWEWL